MLLHSEAVWSVWTGWLDVAAVDVPLRTVVIFNCRGCTLALRLSYALVTTSPPAPICISRVAPDPGLGGWPAVLLSLH
jgi:hypothetical protein